MNLVDRLYRSAWSSHHSTITVNSPRSQRDVTPYSARPGSQGRVDADARNLLCCRGRVLQPCAGSTWVAAMACRVTGEKEPGSTLAGRARRTR